VKIISLNIGKTDIKITGQIKEEIEEDIQIIHKKKDRIDCPRSSS
jgi:hypothetical protein